MRLQRYTAGSVRAVLEVPDTILLPPAWEKGTRSQYLSRFAMPSTG